MVQALKDGQKIYKCSTNIRLLFSFIVAFAMMMEIVGSKEEVREKKTFEEIAKDVNFQVPYVYWVSYLTLQGNLINIPFAFGEAKT